MRLPGVSLSAFIVRLPGSHALYDLKAPALFAPHVLDLHGCFALGCEIQVLLSQMCSQLPDLKLETEQDVSRRKSRREREKDDGKISQEGAEEIVCTSQCSAFLSIAQSSPSKHVPGTLLICSSEASALLLAFGFNCTQNS